MNISVISITIQDYHFSLVINICTHKDLLLFFPFFFSFFVPYKGLQGVTGGLRRKKGTRCPFVSILWFCVRTDVKSIPGIS